MSALRSIAPIAVPKPHFATRNFGMRRFSTNILNASQIIHERGLLAAVQQLEQNPNCKALSKDAIKTAGIIDSHIGYEPVNRIYPLVFGWSSASAATKVLLGGKVPDDRLPNSHFGTPMVTAVEYVNENVSGHSGIIHGGMSTVMAHTYMSLVCALNKTGSTTSPKYLNLDYRSLIPTGSFIKILAWPYGYKSDRVDTAVHFYNMDDKLLVEAIAEIEVSAKN